MAIPPEEEELGGGEGGGSSTGGGDLFVDVDDEDLGGGEDSGSSSSGSGELLVEDAPPPAPPAPSEPAPPVGPSYALDDVAPQRELARSMLNDLPALERDPAIGRVYLAVGNEMARVRAAAHSVAVDLPPATSSTRHGLLDVHEQQLGMRPNHSASLAERRALIAARLRARSVAHGSEWRSAWQAALGEGVPWDFRYDGDVLTITLPEGIAAQRRAALLDFLREITGAHVEIRFDFAEGFVVGYSAVGDRL